MYIYYTYIASFVIYQQSGPSKYVSRAQTCTCAVKGQAYDSHDMCFTCYFKLSLLWCTIDEVKVSSVQSYFAAVSAL